MLAYAAPEKTKNPSVTTVIFSASARNDYFELSDGPYYL